MGRRLQPEPAEEKEALVPLSRPVVAPALLGPRHVDPRHGFERPGGLVAKPLDQGYAKALLGAVDDGGRNQPFERPLEQVLALAPPEFESMRENLESLFAVHQENDRITVFYTTKLYFCKF